MPILANRELNDQHNFPSHRLPTVSPHLAPLPIQAIRPNFFAFHQPTLPNIVYIVYSSHLARRWHKPYAALYRTSGKHFAMAAEACGNLARLAQVSHADRARLTHGACAVLARLVHESHADRAQLAHVLRANLVRIPHKTRSDCMRLACSSSTFLAWLEMAWSDGCTGDKHGNSREEKTHSARSKLQRALE